MKYKVFRFGPDYFLAKNMRDAVRGHCLEINSLTRREAIEECDLVSQKELDDFKYHDDIDDIYRDEEDWQGEHRSLSQECEKVLKVGIKMPHYLCTTEC